MVSAVHFMKSLLPYSFRRVLKRYRRRIYNNFLSSGERIYIDDICNILINNFSISKGDSIIVSSSFANLNAEFSPGQLLDLLQDVVGREGNIVMPYYPPGNSEEWVRSGKVFDMQATPSSMGVLTQEFSMRDNVYKSMHPTKAVIVWGKNSKEIISSHHESSTPFDETTPYGWLLKNKSKSLGLGIKNIPIFHACEDFFSDMHVNMYLEDKFICLVKDRERVYSVPTLVHDSRVINKLVAAGNYIQKLNLDSYKKVTTGYSFCYAVDNQELLARCKEEFSKGQFRYK